jgi:hypothetical protein
MTTGFYTRGRGGASTCAGDQVTADRRDGVLGQPRCQPLPTDRVRGPEPDEVGEVGIGRHIRQRAPGQASRTTLMTARLHPRACSERDFGESIGRMNGGSALGWPTERSLSDAAARRAEVAPRSGRDRMTLCTSASPTPNWPASFSEKPRRSALACTFRPGRNPSGPNLVEHRPVRRYPLERLTQQCVGL